MDFQPITLEGQAVRLEPADARHAASLGKHASIDPDIFAYHFPPPTLDEAGFSQLIDYMHQRPNWLFFAVIDNATGDAIGNTAYIDINTNHQHVEIGFTWVPRTHQRTKINPEMKYLMLRHAFEDQGVLRVQFKTDERNLQSQRAIEKLGGKKEGVLRNHVIMPDGFNRNSVYYSILNSEWLQVKANLEARLGYTL